LTFLTFFLAIEWSPLGFLALGGTGGGATAGSAAGAVSATAVVG